MRWCLGLILLFSQVGCASLWKQSLKTGLTDDGDDNHPGYVDQWEYVGKDARGVRPMEEDPDPLKHWLRSPKAAAIERNLGIQ
ncbi:MAG: hypothetical protein KatS3mg114_0396 [Planctomycetaceae bacterium]|nr:MAG: hypothetical protein KatS3mg114_0396 [Planctomycetaceae bacterium]